MRKYSSPLSTASGRSDGMLDAVPASREVDAIGLPRASARAFADRVSALDDATKEVSPWRTRRRSGRS